MCDCICNQPQYANHGAICPTCEEERDLRDRIMEDNQREYEWLESEAREAELMAEILNRFDRTDWSIGFHDF